MASLSDVLGKWHHSVYKVYQERMNTKVRKDYSQRRNNYNIRLQAWLWIRGMLLTTRFWRHSQCIIWEKIAQRIKIVSKIAYLKSFEYSIVLSPNRMHIEPPCLKICLRRSGSNIGSISSFMFSRRTYQHTKVEMHKSINQLKLSAKKLNSVNDTNVSRVKRFKSLMKLKSARKKSKVF